MYVPIWSFYIGYITTGAYVNTDFITQLVAGLGGIDDYIPTVKEGDIPITLDDKSYYYRPSDGTVIVK